MFTEDNSSAEAIIYPDQNRQRHTQPSKGKERDNSVTPTPDRHEPEQDLKGSYIFDIE